MLLVNSNNQQRKTIQASGVLPPHTTVGGMGDRRADWVGFNAPEISIFLIARTILFLNIRLKFLKSNASARGDEVRTCPKDWFTVKPINVFMKLLAN